MRQTPQEALAAKQELGGKAESSETESFKRTGRHSQSLSQFTNRADVAIDQRSMRRVEPSLIFGRRAAAEHIKQKTINPRSLGGGIGITGEQLVQKRRECGEGWIAGPVNEPIGKLFGIGINQARPTLRQQADSPGAHAACNELGSPAGWPGGDEVRCPLII